jgi:exosortase A
MQLNPPLGIIQESPRRLGAPTLALLLIAFLAPLVFYFDTARAIVEIWQRSETFAHGYIILPICAWLVWRRRANFTLMPPTPYWPALALLALAGFGWMLARIAEVQVVQQYAFAMMIPLTALAVFGRRLAGSLAFPLLFVLAGVPAGEIFIDPLISITADFTVWALQLIGMPVLRNGTVFEIPSGTWSVVEACSGVRYLISSVTLGLLYAYLTYRSNVRRALFVATAVVVPIVANGLRAFMIVMIGHLSGMKLAVGVDHIIYGWLFFGLVMFVMFWIGSFWREDEPAAEPAQPGTAVSPAAAPATARLAAMTAVLVALAALWPAYAAYNARASVNQKPVQLAPFGLSWEATPGFSSWTPEYMAPDAAFNNAYRSAAVAEPVALTVLYYRNQHSAKALISSVNRLAMNQHAIHETGTTMRIEVVAGRQFAVRETRLKGAAGDLLVWHWLWIDGRATTNDYLGKLSQARARLLFHGDDGAAVMLSAPVEEPADKARASLRAFLNANLAPIEAALAATRNR